MTPNGWPATSLIRASRYPDRYRGTLVCQHLSFTVAFELAQVSRRPPNQVTASDLLYYASSA